MKISGVVVFRNEAPFFLKEAVQSFLRLCDEVIAVDTGSTDHQESVKLLESINDGRIKILFKSHTKENNKDFGDIRNWALQFCKGDYVFNFDADEVLDDNYHGIKEQLQISSEVDAWSVRGRHYYWHLNKEDAQVPEHWWYFRLFKNNGNIKYVSNKSHSLPVGWLSEGRLDGVFIHHYGYVKNTVIDLWRYEMNINDLEIHSAGFLNEWLGLRMTGSFPTKPVDLSVHPKVIQDKFYFERWK